MNAMTFGKPNLFLKGIVEQTYKDPTTGDIMGFDNVASEGAIETSVNLQEITGGFGNPIVGIIPDTTRMTGTYTSAAFSLRTRQLITGGNLHYDAVAPVCETITATGTTLTVSKTPVKHYAQSASDTSCWCYVKPTNSSTYVGTNYGVNPTTKVVNFTATNGVSYEVFYFVQNASAMALELPDMFNPSVVTIEQKYGVYAKQNNETSHGTLQGFLYVIIPRAILTGNAGISASQTANATTDGSWMALSPDQNQLVCSDCGSSSKTFAYYVYVPCADANSEVQALAVLGSGITTTEGETTQIPVVYVMPDNSIVTPTYSDLTYKIGGTPATAGTPASDSYASVNVNGVVTGGDTTGNTTVAISLTIGDKTLTCTCAVANTANL